MYVVAVDDDGGERNFLATKIEVVDGVCLAVINGLETAIPLSKLIDVVPVDEAISPDTISHAYCRAPRQHHLS